MLKLFKIFQKINFNSLSVNLKNAIYLARNFITLYRIKLIVFIFTIGYLLFFLLSFYIIYKSYLLTLASLNEFYIKI